MLIVQYTTINKYIVYEHYHTVTMVKSSVILGVIINKMLRRDRIRPEGNHFKKLMLPVVTYFYLKEVLINENTEHIGFSQSNSIKLLILFNRVF